MTTSKLGTKEVQTVEFDDGTTREVVKEGDTVRVRKTFDEAKQELGDMVDEYPDPYVDEMDVDWATFARLSNRDECTRGEVSVASDLLVRFAKRVDRENDSRDGVWLYATENLPLIAALDDGTEIALAPRKTNNE